MLQTLCMFLSSRGSLIITESFENAPFPPVSSVCGYTQTWFCIWFTSECTQLTYTPQYWVLLSALSLTCITYCPTSFRSDHMLIKLLTVAAEWTKSIPGRGTLETSNSSYHTMTSASGCWVVQAEWYCGVITLWHTMSRPVLVAAE